MAKRCSIEGCEKPHFGRGWCGAHYCRWRKYGDPLAGAVSKGERRSQFYQLVALETDECVLFEVSMCKGYPSLTINGEQILAHRLACELVNGPAPAPKLDVAHCRPDGSACISRACINPRHLRWATRKENMADSVAQGFRGRAGWRPELAAAGQR